MHRKVATDLRFAMINDVMQGKYGKRRRERHVHVGHSNHGLQCINLVELLLLVDADLAMIDYDAANECTLPLKSVLMHIKLAGACLACGNVASNTHS